MTAFSFILGVFPLVVASGTGAEARQVMGVALLGGMTIAPLFRGIFISDVICFYWESWQVRTETGTKYFNST